MYVVSTCCFFVSAYSMFSWPCFFVKLQFDLPLNFTLSSLASRIHRLASKLLFYSGSSSSSSSVFISVSGFCVFDMPIQESMFNIFSFIFLNVQVVNLTCRKKQSLINNETGNWFAFVVSKTIHACVSTVKMSREPLFL